MIEEEQQPKTFMDWLRESVVVKLAFICVLVIALLIPSVWIQGLITERQSRQADMAKTVSDQWSASQMIQGPVLVIPYKRLASGMDTTKGKEVIENLYLLPENLKIAADVNGEKLHRGSFDVAVYNSQISVSGNFNMPDLVKISLSPQQLLLNKAHLEFAISDLKGLKTNPMINIKGVNIAAEPVFNRNDVFDNGLQAAMDLNNNTGPIPFSFKLDIKGSQELSFLHVAKTTDVTVKGNWPSPSFGGRYLPDDRKVDSKGFSAHWRALYYNRPYPQEWVANDTLLTSKKNVEQASFGVKLILPVDQYQKTMRTTKYGILIIVLTFTSLLLTELIRKQRVHAFNYLLIGAAMVIYYTLLLSFAEQVGYNLAYLIASVATIGLVSWFISSLLKNTAAAAMFAFILTIFYGFIFIIIQLEDLSLLIGSIALFIIVAILMYVSRKINWEHH
jgi:inner membrane protein